MLRGEVGARALRVRSEVRGDGQVRLCNALGCGGRGCLKPIRRVVLWSQLSFWWRPPRGGLSVASRDSDRCWKQFMMFFGGDSVCGDDSFAIFQSHPRARPGAGGVRTPSLGLHVQGCQCTAVSPQLLLLASKTACPLCGTLLLSSSPPPPGEP